MFVSAVWDIKVPPRIHFFLWLVSKNKILTRDNLRKRKRLDDISCLFGCEVESVLHMFFECAVAAQLWRVLSNILEVNLGGSFESIGQFWLSNKNTVW